MAPAIPYRHPTAGRARHSPVATTDFPASEVVRRSAGRSSGGLGGTEDAGVHPPADDGLRAGAGVEHRGGDRAHRTCDQLFAGRSEIRAPSDRRGCQGRMVENRGEGDADPRTTTRSRCPAAMSASARRGGDVDGFTDAVQHDAVARGRDLRRGDTRDHLPGQVEVLREPVDHPEDRVAQRRVGPTPGTRPGPVCGSGPRRRPTRGRRADSVRPRWSRPDRSGRVRNPRLHQSTPCLAQIDRRRARSRVAGRWMQTALTSSPPPGFSPRVAVGFTH